MTLRIYKNKSEKYTVFLNRTVYIFELKCDIISCNLYKKRKGEKPWDLKI